MDQPQPQFEIVDDAGRVVYTAWSWVKRACRDCGAEYETNIDIQYMCNECLAKGIADCIRGVRRGFTPTPPPLSPPAD